MSINTDNFAYADGFLESVAAAFWIRFETGLSGQLAVVSGKVQNSGGSANSVYVYNATYGGENVYSQGKLDTLGAGWEMGYLLNMQDPGSSTWDGYIAPLYDNGGGTFREEIYRTTNRTTSVQLGSSGTVTISAGDIGMFAHEAADLLKLYRGGVALSGVSGTDSTYSAATAGFYMNSSGGGGWRFDDWEGGDIGAPATKVPYQNPYITILTQ